MAVLSYDLDAMNNTATQLEELVDRWNASKDNLYTIYEELDAMWDGTANDTFTQKFVVEDKEKYQKLSEVMMTYIQVIRTAVQKYIDTEEQVSNIVNKH